jgi:hypothetical protein
MTYDADAAEYNESAYSAEYADFNETPPYDGDPSANAPQTATQAATDKPARKPKPKPEPIALTPTPEQQAILQAVAAAAPGTRIKVAALAGTGKSSTAEMLVAAHPGWAILYLAYNADIVDAAKRRFKKAELDHATVLTTHGLAWRMLDVAQWIPQKGAPRSMRRWEVDRWLRQTRCSVPSTVRHGTAGHIVLTTTRTYCQSADPEPTVAHVPEMVMDAETRKWAAETAKQLFRAMLDIKNATIPLEHDAYLKYFQTQQMPLHYNLIILDEAQDSNKCVMAIADAQAGIQILLGDENQMINRYRGATSAMKTPGAEYPLSQSWRFGEAIADLANVVMQFIPGNWPTFTPLRGTPSIHSTIGPINETPYTVLCRSNRGVFEAAFEAASAGLRINSGAKDLEDAILLVESAHALMTNTRLQKRHPDIQEFRDWDQLTEEAQHDESLKWLKKLVETHADDMAEICQALRDAKTRMKKQADVLIVTCHRSKGLEYENVILADDFAGLNIAIQKMVDALGKIAAPTEADLRAAFKSLPVDELNLLYVAVTRAQGRLQTNSTVRALEGLQSKIARICRPQAATVAVQEAPPVAPEPVAPLEAANTDDPLAALPARHPAVFCYAAFPADLQDALKKSALVFEWQPEDWILQIEIIQDDLMAGRNSAAELAATYKAGAENFLQIAA